MLGDLILQVSENAEKDILMRNFMICTACQML